MPITEKQRRFIYVLLKQYSKKYLYRLEDAKELLKERFCKMCEIEHFSLSSVKANSCTTETAKEFIGFILAELRGSCS